MIIITCMDNRGGLMFNGRRQSRDRAVQEDIAKLGEKAPVYMSPYSYTLFKGVGAAEGGEEQPLLGIFPSENLLQETGPGVYCFLEGQSILGYQEQIEKIIFYRWNRDYPADVYWEFPMDNWELEKAMDFSGYSHETITREIYKRKNS